ncbi:MAG: MBOAT family O-acyltransferase [Acidaminobacteraceae bacterium]
MKPTLGKYISRKLGGVEGELPRLRYMLIKSFTAQNFRLFWNAWNPIYSYILLYYVYKPSRKILPKYIALLLTFAVNGLFHDVMVFIILKSTNFIITKLFVTYGLIVILETVMNFTLFNQKSIKRVLYNVFLLFTPIVVLLMLRG